MRRDIFTADHEAFRDMVRSFISKEITPYHEQWERDGVVSRDVWLAAGRAGLLGIDIDEKYGGGETPTTGTTWSSTRSWPGPGRPARRSACTTT